MAAARRIRAMSDEDDAGTAKPATTRTRALTTAMPGAESAVAKKRGATKRAVKKSAAKKSAAKKPAAKPSVAEKAAAGTRPVQKKTIAEQPVVEFGPARGSATERLDDSPPTTGATLVARVSSAIERELNQIERIVGGHRIKPAQRTEAERRARTLASLARTLSEVARLRAQHQQRPDDDDDAMPRDLDEFRETLARRLERLLADESQSPDGDVQPG